jgi:hypothetical protein
LILHPTIVYIKDLQRTRLVPCFYANLKWKSNAFGRSERSTFDFGSHTRVINCTTPANPVEDVADVLVLRICAAKHTPYPSDLLNYG